jgi:hypothetical protein
MAAHESLLIDHALDVLREIARDRTRGSRQCPALKLALRVLLERSEQRWCINDFWRFAEEPDPNHRCRNLRATLGTVASCVGRNAELFRV